MILPLDRDLIAQWAEHGIPTDPSTLDCVSLSGYSASTTHSPPT